jgi:hypothetical protein
MDATQPVAMPTLLLDKYKFMGYTKKKNYWILFISSRREKNICLKIYYISKEVQEHKLTSK